MSICSSNSTVQSASFEFVRLQRQLGELVGHRVDLVTPAALKPQFRDRILSEAVVAASS